MGNSKLAVLLTTSIVLAFYISFLQFSVYGQIESLNDIFKVNNNISTVASSNNTAIIGNTSGMMDDAFDALKDSFGSFFGQ